MIGDAWMGNVIYSLYTATVPLVLWVTQIETELGNAWYDQQSCCNKWVHMIMDADDHSSVRVYIYSGWTLPKKLPLPRYTLFLVQNTFNHLPRDSIIEPPSVMSGEGSKSMSSTHHKSEHSKSHHGRSHGSRSRRSGHSISRHHGRPPFMAMLLCCTDSWGLYNAPPMRRSTGKSRSHGHKHNHKHKHSKKSSHTATESRVGHWVDEVSSEAPPVEAAPAEEPAEEPPTEEASAKKPSTEKPPAQSTAKASPSTAGPASTKSHISDWGSCTPNIVYIDKNNSLWLRLKAIGSIYSDVNLLWIALGTNNSSMISREIKVSFDVSVSSLTINRATTTVKKK